MSQEPAKKRTRRGTPMFYEIAPPSTWTYNVRTTSRSSNAYIASAEGGRVRMQLPRCRIPFGVQEPVNSVLDTKEENKSRPNLELDVADPALVQWGASVNAAAVDYVAEHSKELMKKFMKKDFVEQLFRPVITPSSNGEFNPLLRTKITKTGSYATKVRVVTDPGSPTTPLRHREGTINEIERGDEIIAVVDVSSIWFANNSAGLTLTLAHALVYKKENEVEDVFTVGGVAGMEVDMGPPPAPALSLASGSNTSLPPGTITVNLYGEELVASDPFA